MKASSRIWTATVFTAAILLWLIILHSPVDAYWHKSIHRESHVIDTTLFALPERFGGACPGVIKFKGKITTDGPGVVKYTFTRSDGANGPIHRLDFAAAGSQEVETDWTLGDSAVLPHYEGWQAIRILAPNELESNRAQFVLDCTQGSGPPPQAQPQPDPGAKPASPSQQQDGVELYQSIQPQLGGPHLQQLQTDLTKLQTLGEDLQSRLEREPKPAGFDRQRMEEEFRAIQREPDFGKQKQSTEAFGARYEAQFSQQIAAAGIDPGNERQRMSSLLGFSADSVSAAVANSRNLLIVRIPPPELIPAERPPATVAPSDTLVDNFPPPYSGGGTQGAETGFAAADPGVGSLRVNNSVGIAGRERTTAFLTQNLPVRVGARRVRVAVEFTEINYSIGVATLAGAASAEGFVNLSVLDGVRVVAGARRSLGRAAASLFSAGGPSGTAHSPTLVCEFDIASPSVPTNLIIVAELEGVVGAAGVAIATVSMSGKLRQFTVTSRF